MIMAVDETRIARQLVQGICERCIIALVTQQPQFWQWSGRMGLVSRHSRAIARK